MTVALATIVLQLAGLYLGAGLVFAVIFVTRGIARVDPAGVDAPIGFRLIVLPGVTVLWPLMAWRWLRAERGPPVERSAHILASRETEKAPP